MPVAAEPVEAELVLLTVIVYVRFVPALTGPGLPVFVMLRSARPVIVVDVAAELLA